MRDYEGSSFRTDTRGEIAAPIVRWVVAWSCMLGVAVLATAPARAASDIWISPAEARALSRSGPAWENLLAEARSSAATPKLSDGSDPTNVRILAKALVFAATGQASYRSEVETALDKIAASGTYSGRALALGRELAAYVIAADLVAVRTHAPALDARFRTKLRQLLTTPTRNGPDNLVDCHESRPNNWGTHCGATRIAIALYLDDQAELAAAAKVFRGWLGIRSAYDGFSFGSLSWQSDSARPVAINPRGAKIQGHDVDGVLPDDQRRAGGFAWPPPKSSYSYEALQGALVQAVLLSRAGYDAWGWQNRALLRAYTWLNTTRFDDGQTFPAEGDDAWQPHLVNYFYGSNFPVSSPASAGKNMGWTDWTHSGAAGAECIARVARLRVGHSEGKPDTLSARATFDSGPGGLDELAPSASGLVTFLETAESQTSVTAPAKAFDGTSGWRSRNGGRVWCYVNRRRPTPGEEVSFLRLVIGREKRTIVRVNATGSFPVTSLQGPPTISFQAGDGSPINGCHSYSFRFLPMHCADDFSRSDVRCRAR